MLYDGNVEKIRNPFGDHHDHDVGYMLLKDKIVATIPDGKPMFSYYSDTLQWEEVKPWGDK